MSSVQRLGLHTIPSGRAHCRACVYECDDDRAVDAIVDLRRYRRWSVRTREKVLLCSLNSPPPIREWKVAR